jgi:ATP-dependent DNA ligase
MALADSSGKPLDWVVSFGTSQLGLVAFAEWAEGDQLRQTTFLGWRDDKSPEEVLLE